MSKNVNQASAIADYKELFESDVGRKVLFSLIKSYGVLNSTHVPGDPYSTAFNEGQRSVVLMIMRKAKTDIKKFLKALEDMQKEQQSLSEGDF